MDITRFSIEKTRITGVALGILVVYGLLAYTSMPQDEDPGFTIRTATVITTFPGASPRRVELLVTDAIEEVVQEIPELDDVTSVSKPATSIVFVNIKESETNLRPIWDSLRRKVDKVRSSLPEGVIGPTVNDEFGDVFGHVITVSESVGDGMAPGYSYKDLEDVAETLRDELLHVPDVAKVEIHGVQEERIFVEYENARLAELGISPVMMQQMLASRNIVSSGGAVNAFQKAQDAGRPDAPAEVPVERLALEPSGNFESVEDVRRTISTLPGSSEVVFLEDVARVHRDYVDPPSSLARTAGRPCLVLGVSMRAGGNILTLGGGVERVIDEARAQQPLGLEFGLVAMQGERVETLVDGFVGNVLQSIGLVLLVMLVSLGLRTGLTVSTLIPTAILMTFCVMPLFDIGIDQISLASLIIALGMLVDNAIVMSESVLVQMEEGKPAKEAAIDSARELRIPLLTSSLTTAAAFLPIYLAESNLGEYCAAIFQVVTITLLCSWFLSLTLVPLVCTLMLRVERRTDGPERTSEYSSRFYRLYRGSLLLALRFRTLTILLVLLAFVASLWAFRFVTVIFMPESERKIVTCELTLASGAPIERTEATVRELEGFLGTLREENADGNAVESWVAYVGDGGPRYILPYGPELAAPEYAFLLINTRLGDIEANERIARAIEEFCFEELPEARANVDLVSNGPAVKYPVVVRVLGPNRAGVAARVEVIKERLRETPGVGTVSDDWGVRSKKLVVGIDQPRAYRAGVSSQDVAVSLQTSLSGLRTTEYREGDDIIPVVLRSNRARRDDVTSVGGINVFSQATGAAVPLEQVADLDLEFQSSVIRRKNRYISTEVRALLEPGRTATEINATIEPWLVEYAATWPSGYSWEYGGEAESSGEANASLLEKLPFGGLLIVLLLVAQFNSLRKPMIILLTIPLGIIGVVIGLLALDAIFGFFTLLGVVSLSGIVINNAIVLLDRIQLEIDGNGRSPARAVIESAQRRLRPIVLTTCTTIGGMVPLYLGGGAMWEPMAVAIMFGLLFATGLTLGVVPVLYSIFYRVSFRGFRYEDG